MVREATKNDLNDLLQLYLHLHEDKIPEDFAESERNMGEKTTVIK